MIVNSQFYEFLEVMMKSQLLATAIGFATATTALAGSAEPAPQDVAMIAPPATAYDWSGLYVGGLVSFDSGDVELFNGNVPFNFAALDPTAAFGGFVGYNKQVNALVFGGELAYTTGDVVAVGYANSIYTDRIDLKARAGYSFGRVMAYGVVGYSFADFDDARTPYPSSGLNYGVGVDVMINDHLFVGAEYLTRDLSGDNGAFRLDGNLDSATIRAGYRFWRLNDTVTAPA